MIYMNSDRIFADLHVHSSASDGLLTPRQLLIQAKEVGLSALGLTDHDTLSGIPEGMLAAQEIGIKLIPGIEISCGWPDSEISLHVIGLFIDPGAAKLIELLDRQRKSRYVRALKILDKLEALNISVAPLRQQFMDQSDRVLGRPHVARYLLESGYVGEVQEAFQKYLGRGKPAYVPKEHILPAVGIDAIHHAGGVALIAHPGLLPDWNTLWPQIETLPWDGIEVYYSDHTPQQIEFFSRLASEHNLAIGGGSDYHGEYGKHVNRLGQFGIDEIHFNELQRRAIMRSHKNIESQKTKYSNEFLLSPAK